MQGKKLFIQTMGCAMNVRDSEHIIAELGNNYSICTESKDADLIIINTCSVREKPVQKLFSEIGFLVKNKKKSAKLGVCGCTASHLGKEIFSKAPEVNFVLGARSVSRIKEAINSNKYLHVDMEHDETEYNFETYRSTPYKSLVNISIGCDKRCTYCIVPFTRGDEISIPPNLLLAEIKKSVLQGAKEVMLLGQNVNGYGKRFGSKSEKDINFTKLLHLIGEIDGLERIRFTSPHPLHMDDEFLETFASHPKICKSMHMPLQSGSTKILRAMKRGYSKEWFLERVGKLRDLCPETSISTDIIVGFPGEEEYDFEETMSVVNSVKFDQIFSFVYSSRPLTAASKFENKVDTQIAKRRLEFLQQRQNEILDEKALYYENKIFNVYVEELKNDGKVAGRTDNNSLVILDGSDELLGKIVPVLITQAKRTTLYGTLIK